MAKKFIDPLEDEPFEMPEAIFNSLGECSPEGYILFYIDNTGQPKVRADFNSQIAEMGLRSYATKLFNGVNHIEESGIAETLLQDQEGLDSDDFFE